MPLINLKDKRKTNKLLGSIKDSTKTVAIHILLTKMLEPDKGDFSYQYHYDEKVKNKQISINNPPRMSKVTHTFNGLSWNLIYKESKSIYDISQQETKKIQQYWKKKIRSEQCCCL